jgi:alpha-tubulin suppressor-like RCC1 family protein
VLATGANGKLGNGSAQHSSVPVQVTGLTDVTAVATSNTHTCVIANGGQPYCWGSNSHGELGNEGVGAGRVPVPITGSVPKPVVTPTPTPTPKPTPKPAY